MRSLVNFLFIASLMAVALPARSATWYMFGLAGTDKVIYFFDRDSITKAAGTVTIWTKAIRKKETPDSDGSVSVTYRTKYSCAARTGQMLAMTSNSADGNVVHSSNRAGEVAHIIPGTIGESILAAVCRPGFPAKDGDGDHYFPLAINDPALAAQRVFESVEAPK